MRREANTWFLLALAAVALYLCYVVAEPFLNPIFAALVLAIVFYPLHTRIQTRIGRPNLAATLSTILVLLIVAIPTAFFAFVITGELGDLYHALSEKSAAQGGASPFVMHLLERPLQFLGKYIDLSRFDLRSTLLGWINQVSRSLVAFGARAVSNIFSLIFAIVVVFFTLFFFLRDGPRIQHRVATLLPLTPEQSETLLNRVSQTIVASVYGGIAVGLVQGFLTGLAFWVLGLPSPVVWGLVAAMASLIPVVGTGIVWVPAALVLLIEGHWVKSLILIGWCAAVVAQVDAVVRPYVISGRAKMNNLLIFFALLGGVRAFGIMGLFIGPVVVAVTIAVLDMLREINLSSAQSERKQTAAIVE